MKGTEKIYFENPIEAIKFWISKEAKRIHIIDLNGAWGSNLNEGLLKSIISKVKDKIKIQVGGGIRSIEVAVNLIKLGADRVIIGTKAIENQKFIKKLLQKLKSERVIVALDYSEGLLKSHGWTRKTNLNAFSFGKEIINLGARYILFSCIDLDGTLLGPDFQNIQKMARIVGAKHLYVAGGFGKLEEIYRLKQLVDVKGVIIGKAFYEKKIPFSIIKNFIAPKR